MDAARIPEALHWQLLRGRIAQLEAGAHALIANIGLAVPDWPFDKARLVKVALLEAESALKRAEQASGGAVLIAQMAEKIVD